MLILTWPSFSNSTAHCFANGYLFSSSLIAVGTIMETNVGRHRHFCRHAEPRPDRAIVRLLGAQIFGRSKPMETKNSIFGLAPLLSLTGCQE